MRPSKDQAQNRDKAIEHARPFVDSRPVFKWGREVVLTESEHIDGQSYDLQIEDHHLQLEFDPADTMWFSASAPTAGVNIKNIQIECLNQDAFILDIIRHIVETPNQPYNTELAKDQFQVREFVSAFTTELDNLRKVAPYDLRTYFEGMHDRISGIYAASARKILLTLELEEYASLLKKEEMPDDLFTRTKKLIEEKAPVEQTTLRASNFLLKVLGKIENKV